MKRQRLSCSFRIVRKSSSDKYAAPTLEAGCSITQLNVFCKTYLKADLILCALTFNLLTYLIYRNLLPYCYVGQPIS